jgi:hypothetical protein
LHPNKQKYKSEKETHKNIKLKHERNIVEITHMCIRHGAHTRIYIYINKDENPFTISTRHVKANINTGEKNQNNRIEVEDLMLTGHALP